ncbi:ABC transporter substrate-binding protein [Intrasporangium sp.]|uniref:ABC transporter substrate-binding protein n=1 Tax=Intrasporangium sp. TaxID=1925024 RepID=UPI00293B099D|nr:ABC transporter substrate-binding protein [Intrasporangium sp.]MDV3220677.1 ABC transporter substrate-binding protein [Intrasporangium sp.]
MARGIRARTLMIAVAAAIPLAACSSTDPTPASNDSTGAAGAKGGTVTVYHENDFEHLDPVRSFVTDSSMASKLISRKLMEYKWDGAAEQIVLTNDLAETVEHSEDFKTWTFTLKDGLKYEDGTPIKAADIKYNVERSFVPDMSEGAPYARQMVVCEEGYKGPYSPPGNNGGKGCSGITTPDDKTIVFTLQTANPEFDHTTTMPTFAPVPEAKDTKTDYDNHPVSSGPYMIENYERDKTLTLVRNPHWDASTDEVRTALPDKFVFVFGQDPATVDQRLILDGEADQASLSFSAVQPANLGKLNQPRVKDRVVEGEDVCRRYIAFNQQKELLKDQKLREALYVGLDRQAWISGRGGERLNRLVDSIIPSSMKGYHEGNPFPAPPTGDVAKAKQLLAESGYNGETLTLGTADVGVAVKAAEAAQASWKKIGVNIEIRKIVGANYYTQQQNDESATDLITAGWCYDWASLSSVVPPVLGPDTSQAGKAGPNNYSRSQVGWDKMAEIREMSDNDAAQEAWSTLYDEIMKTAPLVPISQDLNIYVTGSRITNATADPNTGGLIDLAQIAVKPGS